MKISVWCLARISVRAFSRLASCRSARESFAPREARRCAVAKPIPDAAPVMAMTLSLNWVGDDMMVVGTKRGSRLER